MLNVRRLGRIFADAELRIPRRAEQTMGMPAIAKHVWTYEEVHQLIEDQSDRSVRYEYADGELLVTPGPGGYHQRVILALFRLVDPYVRANAIGEVRLGPSEINLVPKTIFQPDLYVVPSVNGRRPRADIRVIESELVVEVLSPGSKRHDRITKRKYYQRGGVPEYWIVDQEAELVERWRPGDIRPEILDSAIAWGVEGVREPLSIELAGLFASVRDD
jgi:Uma2 family endonuclease